MKNPITTIRKSPIYKIECGIDEIKDSMYELVEKSISEGNFPLLLEFEYSRNRFLLTLHSENQKELTFNGQGLQ